MFGGEQTASRLGRPPEFKGDPEGELGDAAAPWALDAPAAPAEAMTASQAPGDAGVEHKRMGSICFRGVNP